MTSCLETEQQALFLQPGAHRGQAKSQQLSNATRQYTPPYTDLYCSVTWNEDQIDELIRPHHTTENCKGRLSE